MIHSEKSGRSPIILIGNSVAAARGYKNTNLNGHPFLHAPIFIHFYEDRNSPTKLLNIEELAQRCISDIIQAWPNGPYIIIGECQNSIVAHEVAHQLTWSGHPVELLCVIDENWATSDISKNKQDFALIRQLRNLKRFGVAHMVKKIVTKIKKKIAGYIRMLDNTRETICIFLGQPVPEAIQFRKMERVFLDACESSRYTPPTYAGEVLLLYSNRWFETHLPQLNQYYTGPCKKQNFQIMHSEWFTPRNITRIVQLIDTYPHKK